MWQIPAGVAPSGSRLFSYSSAQLPVLDGRAASHDLTIVPMHRELHIDKMSDEFGHTRFC
jgi:hypothetical protein